MSHSPKWGWSGPKRLSTSTVLSTDLIHRLSIRDELHTPAVLPHCNCVAQLGMDAVHRLSPIGMVVTPKQNLSIVLNVRIHLLVVGYWPKTRRPLTCHSVWQFDHDQGVWSLWWHRLVHTAINNMLGECYFIRLNISPLPGHFQSDACLLAEHKVLQLSENRACNLSIDAWAMPNWRCVADCVTPAEVEKDLCLKANLELVPGIHNEEGVAMKDVPMMPTTLLVAPHETTSQSTLHSNISTLVTPARFFATGALENGFPHLRLNQ
eukprot:2617171-Amphidinium_carterae.1